MSEQTDTYTLRQPIKAVLIDKPEYPGQVPFWQYELANGEIHYLKVDDFERLFIQVSEEKQELREQLEKIMDDLGDYRDVEGYFRARDEAVDAVLALISSSKETE